MEERVVRDFTDLVVWQKAMDLSVLVYGVTRQFPREETYGLTSQLRRSAVSVPSNIAEGNGRRTRKDYVAFLCIARGSISELQTQLILARRLGFLVGNSELQTRAVEVARMLNALITSLTKTP